MPNPGMTKPWFKRDLIYRQSLSIFFDQRELISPLPFVTTEVLPSVLSTAFPSARGFAANWDCNKLHLKLHVCNVSVLAFETPWL